MSDDRLYLLSVGPQRLLVAAAGVAYVRRLRGTRAAPASQPAALPRELGSVRLYDLGAWLGAGQAPAGAERRIVLVVELDGGLAGLLADAIDDTVRLDAPPQPLPALLGELGYDPAVTAMALIDGTPRLMVDLAQVARSQRAAVAGALAQGV